MQDNFEKFASEKADTPDINDEQDDVDDNKISSIEETGQILM